MDAEVIVVGGGPAGAATAFFLARAGCDVLVLDRAVFPRDKPCSEYLSPQGSRLLHEMGALEAVERAGAARLRGMRVIAPDGTAFSGTFAASHGYHGFRTEGLAIRRTVLDAMLLDRARAVGARVEEGVAARDLAYNGAGRVCGVLARGAGGALSTRRAPLVVGADGLRSVVARRAGLGRHGRWPRRVALVTHYRGVRDPGDMGEMHVGPSGYVGIAAVDDGLVNVAMVVPAGRDTGMAGDPSGFLRRHLARFELAARRLTGAEQATPVRAVGPFNWHARRAWRPGAALVGDAADFFDPFTGEGIYAALRGGELLAPYALAAIRAAHPRDADVALAAYDRCRRHEFRGKWMVERIIGAAVASPPAMNLAARALDRRRDLADLLVGVTGDFVPAREVLRPGYLLALASAALSAPAPPP